MSQNALTDTTWHIQNTGTSFAIMCKGIRIVNIRYSGAEAFDMDEAKAIAQLIAAGPDLLKKLTLDAKSLKKIAGLIDIDPFARMIISLITEENESLIETINA